MERNLRPGKEIQCSRLNEARGAESGTMVTLDQYQDGIWKAFVLGEQCKAREIGKITY